MKTKEEILDKHLSEKGICCNREDGYIDDYGVYSVIETAMEEYANQDKWISVEDSLPDEGLDVLCISEEGCMSIEKRRYGKKEIYCDQTDSGYATHWQPLPNPPKI